MTVRSFQGRIIALVVAAVVIIALLPSNSYIPSLPLQTIQSPQKSAWLASRMDLSEKAWQKSVYQRGEMAKTHPDNPQVPFFPTDFMKYPFTIWDFFPPTYTCPHDFQRVGRLGDGGKWVCGMSLYEAMPKPPAASAIDSGDGKNTLVIYSFGINGESSFEAEMLDRVESAKIWGYDFSVDGWGKQIPQNERHRVFFKKVGLGSEDDAEKSPPFFTLPTLMAQNNHTYIDILKIDVEGAEFTALDTMMDAFSDANGVGTLPIGQVMIEIHLNDHKVVNFDRFRKWWERLEKMGMRPAWLEINLFAVTLGKNKSDPRCAEYVWVNAKDQRNVLWKA